MRVKMPIESVIDSPGLMHYAILLGVYKKIQMRLDLPNAFSSIHSSVSVTLPDNISLCYDKWCYGTSVRYNFYLMTMKSPVNRVK